MTQRPAHQHYTGRGDRREASPTMYAESENSAMNFD